MTRAEEVLDALTERISEFSCLCGKALYTTMSGLRCLACLFDVDLGGLTLKVEGRAVLFAGNPPNYTNPGDTVYFRVTDDFGVKSFEYHAR